MMDYFESNCEDRYIFLTVTVENIFDDLLDLLSSKFKKLSKTFKHLIEGKKFKNIAKGWFSCFEVTHNWERNSYHSHLYVFIAVNKNYFRGSIEGYLSKKQWDKLWQSCLM